MFSKYISSFLLNTLIFLQCIIIIILLLYTVFEVFLHPCKNHVSSTQTHLLPAFSLMAPNKLFVHTECSVYLDTIKGYELCASLHLRTSAVFIIIDRKWPEVGYQLLSEVSAEHKYTHFITVSLHPCLICVYTSGPSVLITSYQLSNVQSLRFLPIWSNVGFLIALSL